MLSPDVLNGGHGVRSVEDHPGPQIAHAAEFRGEFDDESFSRAIRDATRAFEVAGVPYVFMGGLAATSYGRPRWTHDLDVFVKPQDAIRALDALKADGFETERTDEAWLYKGFRDKVMLDVIFKSKGNIYFDDEMYHRSEIVDFRGTPVRVIPPEDLLVIKSAVHDEVGPRHWHDALSIIAAKRIDWDYLMKRSRASPRRVMALLCYAQSNDLMVPNRVIRKLFDELYDS